MKTLMLDTNIFDDLIVDSLLPDIYDALGEYFIFLTTSIQEGELAALSDKRRRQLMQGIPRNVVPLHSPANLTQDTNVRHHHDALIAYTAQEAADVLLTNDQPLAQWCSEIVVSLVVWNYQEFINWFLSLDQPSK